jgi:hypothetical protein
MTTAFVFGNGVSRLNIPLTTLQSKGKIYGCNALYRDFTPHVLVATDPNIAEHIQHSQYALTNRFYTRKPILGLGGLPVPHYRYSSGPNAVAIAVSDECLPIYLIGFDMASVQEETFNNVYAGTEYYKPTNSTPTYSGNWENQLYHIIETNWNRGFIRVLGETSSRNTRLDTLKNYSTMEITKFLIMINTQY